MASGSYINLIVTRNSGSSPQISASGTDVAGTVIFGQQGGAYNEAADIIFDNPGIGTWTYVLRGILAYDGLETMASIYRRVLIATLVKR